MGQTQQAVAEAAAHVLGGYARGPAAGQRGQPSLGAGQDGPAAGQDDSYDRALWKELAKAGLLGLAVPGSLGGEGLGVAETAVLLTEAGRAAAPVPALATLAMGVLPVTRWGTRDQQQVLLAGVPAGDAVLTAAIREPSEPAPPVPATALREQRSGLRHRLRGQDRRAVRGAASWILVPASLGSGGAAIAVIGTSAPGVTLRPHAKLLRRPGVHRCGWTRPRSRTSSGGNDTVGGPVPARRGRRLLPGRRRPGRGARADHRRTSGPGSSSAGRSPRSRRSPSRSPTSTSRAAPCTWPRVSACWRLATGRDAGGRHRRRRVLARRRGARGAADLPSPARRDRHGRQLPAAPLLRAGQGPGQPRRRRRLPARPGSATGPGEAACSSTSPRSNWRCATSCGTTSPG